MPSYQRLKTMVRRHIDQIIRTRIFRARNGRIETGVSVKSHKRKNVSGERKVGECYQWKANGQKGEAHSFRHDDSMRGKLTQPSSLAPRPQTQNDGSCPSEWKSPRVRSPSGRERQKPYKNYFKGTCTNPSCNYWYPPVCQNCKI